MNQRPDTREILHLICQVISLCLLFIFGAVLVVHERPLPGCVAVGIASGSLFVIYALHVSKESR